MLSLIIHIINEDPVMGEVDALPLPTDNLIVIKNPRRKDGKDINYLEPNVNTVIWPLQKINYIEIIPTGEEDEIISFVRE